MQDIRTPAVAIVALLATALSAGCGGASGEGDGTPAQSTFSKSYGGAAHDVAHAVVASADGGFLLAGHANAARISSIEPEGGDLWITKLDADGDVEVQRLLGEQPAGTAATQFVRARPTADGGAILVGSTQGSGSDIAVTKVDSAGSVQWARSYDSGPWLNYEYFIADGRQAAADYGNDVWPIADGGYLVAGVSYGNLEDRFGIGFPCPLAHAPDEDPCQTALPGHPGRRYVNAISVVVLRLDADGGVRWVRRLTDEAFNPESTDLASSGSSPEPIVRATAQGGAVVVRTLRRETLVHRLLADGSPLPPTVIEDQLTVVDIQQTDDHNPVDPDDGLPDGQRDGVQDDGFVFAASYVHGARVIKLDRRGAVEWTRQLGSTDVLSPGPFVHLHAVYQRCNALPAAPCVFATVGDYRESGEDPANRFGYLALLDNAGNVVGRHFTTDARTLERIRDGENGAPYRFIGRDDAERHFLLELDSTDANAAIGKRGEYARFELAWPVGEFTADGGALYFDKGRLVRTDVRNVVVSDVSLSTAEASERALAAVEIAPGRFVVAGQAGEATAWVLRYDVDRDGGRLVWQRRLPAGESVGRIEALAASGDGGIVLASQRDRALRLVKVDAEGTFTWHSADLVPMDDGLYYRWREIHATADGGFIALAASNSGDRSTTVVAKLDRGGALQWRRRYALGGVGSLAPASDGGHVLVAGSSASNLFRVVKLDAAGTPQWAKSYGSYFAHSVGLPRIRRSPDGGYVIGVTESGMLDRIGEEGERMPLGQNNVLLLKIDAAGAVLWARDFGALQDEALNDLAVRADGMIVAAGWSDSFGEGREAWLLKLGPDGLVTSASCNALLASLPVGVFTVEELVIVAEDLPAPAPAGAAPLLQDGGPDPRDAPGFVTARQCHGSVEAPVTPGPQFRLTVLEVGGGRGVVTSTPAGIACGTGLGDAFCAADFAAGSRVSLRADPTRFRRWEPDCDDGTGGTNEVCVVILDRERTVRVTFDPPRDLRYELAFAVQGEGRVRQPDGAIVCRQGSAPEQCAAVVAPGASVRILAEPDAGRAFQGWSGACASFGTQTDITILVAVNTYCSAQFTTSDAMPPGPFRLSVLKTGGGEARVQSQPAGIDCGADCSEDYVGATRVELFPTLAAGSAFNGWSGCDEVIDGRICRVTVSASRSVTLALGP